MLCRQKQSIWFSVVKIQSGVKVMSAGYGKPRKTCKIKAFGVLCIIPTRKYIFKLWSSGCVFVSFYIRFWAVFRQFRPFNLQSGVKMWCRREDNFGHHILPTGQ